MLRLAHEKDIFREWCNTNVTSAVCSLNPPTPAKNNNNNFINLLLFKCKKKVPPKTTINARQLNKIPANFYLKTDTVKCQISVGGKDTTEAKLCVSQKYQGKEENLRGREDYQ